MRPVCEPERHGKLLMSNKLSKIEGDRRSTWQLGVEARRFRYIIIGFRVYYYIGLHSRLG